MDTYDGLTSSNVCLHFDFSSVGLKFEWLISLFSSLVKLVTFLHSLSRYSINKKGIKQIPKIFNKKIDKLAIGA